MKLPVKYDSLTPEEKREVRLLYVAKQNGMCHYCGGRLNAPPLIDEKLYNPINWRLFPRGKEGFLKYPVHLHHNHRTGMTIGALHAFCNAHSFYYKGE